jgi:hypothetical protein
MVKEGELDSLLVSRPSAEKNTMEASHANTGPSPTIIKLLTQGHPLLQHKV